MKRAYPPEHHRDTKRQKSQAHHTNSKHAPPKSNRPQPYQPRQHQQPAPQPDSTKHLESLLKSLISRPDTTKQLLGQDAFDSAVKLSESLLKFTSASASLDLFQPSTIQTSQMTPELPQTFPSLDVQRMPLPELPHVPKGPYSRAPFIHKSNSQHDRTSAIGDLTYERLEFLGDAYLEVIATRLIYSRYPHLAAGRQAQIRERLVKNETLTHFSHAYGFQDRLQAGEGEKGMAKASGKIMADVFEAYVAAIILSDSANGFARVETWLTELWAPILLREFGPINVDGGAALNEYNQNAKQELQQKIVGKGIKLEYLESKPMEQTKHMQRYFISLFLTGWGYERRLLGSGEGQNKVEAGNRAAMDAMVKSKDIVDDAARQLSALREQKRLEAEGINGNARTL